MKICFTTHPQASYITRVVAKSTTERRNSYNLTLADKCAPRAFFIRSLRTPKERQERPERLERHSMVTRSEKGSPFAVFQCLQFSTSLRVAAKIVENLAVTSILNTGVIKMIHSFLAIPRTTYNLLKFYFTTPPQARYITLAVLNQTASRDKLNIQKANTSAPNIYNHRAFFVRSTHTPKENAMRVILSMVARNGQPFAVGCFPFEAVCHPVTRYRPTVTSEAIALNQKEIAMLYKFLCVHRNQPTYTETTISVNAPNLNEARWALPSDYRLLIERPISTLPNSAGVADFCAKPTACNAPSFAMGGRYV